MYTQKQLIAFIDQEFNQNYKFDKLENPLDKKARNFD